MDCELQHYLTTALWSSYDESTPEGGEPFDRNYDASDVAPEALASMREDLQAFVDAADNHALVFWEAELGAGQIGHDFWLTRNGHGAGFWDRFMRGVGADFGRHLTDTAKPYGESHPYLGDDGLIYVA